MKIVFVCNEYPPAPHGGIGVNAKTLATELAKRGHQVRVIGIYSKIFSTALPQKEDGVLVWRLQLPGYKLGWLTARLQVYNVISKWIQDGDADIIDVADYEGFVAGWPKLNAPVVTRAGGTGSYHRVECGLRAIRKYYWIEKASIRRSDFCSAVSNYYAHALENLYELKRDTVTPIYNPVTIPVISEEKQSSKKSVVFTGTLVPRKGIINLVKAWRTVLQQSPTAELNVYGKDGLTQDGKPMKAFLLSLLEPNALKSVFFHGHVDHLRLLNALQEARVGVFPSYSETFGLAPVEAMAVGCPAIYTKRSCGPEIITDDEDGLLVDPDSPHEIADSIIRVMQDDDLADRLGKAGRKTVREKFSTDIIIPQNEAFFAKCIERFQEKSSHVR